MTLSDFSSPKIEARSAQFEPQRIYPTQARPLLQKKHFKLRDLRPWVRRRGLDRREDRLGVAGRISARYTGESVSAASGEKVAIYCSTGCVSAMVQSQLATYAAEGFEVIFVSMCKSLDDDDVARLRRLCREIVMRRSFGRDFGAWRDVLSSGIVRCDQVRALLLVNDSVLGPIRPLKPLFERMRTAEGLWGLVNSDQNGAHLQTFFLLARGRAAVGCTLDFFDKLVLSTDKERS